MPLLYDLIETYDTVQEHELDNISEKIAPIGHCYVSNGGGVINFRIDTDGNFTDASIDEQSGRTLIAATEESTGSKTGKNASQKPHALNGSMQSISSTHYVDNSTGKNLAYIAYMNQLKAWCNSEYSCIQIKAVYKYLSEHDPIDDMIATGVLVPGKDGKYNIEKIKKVLVRWKVGPDENDTENTWENKTVLRSWTEYYSNMHQRESERQVIDGISGKLCDPEKKHPKSIKAYPKAKLISVANEEKFIMNYTGERFTDFKNNDQGIHIGYQNAQKIHNALTWLIDTQSVLIARSAVFKNNQKAKPRFLVCWNPHYQGIDNRIKGLGGLLGLDKRIDNSSGIYQDFSTQLKKLVYGNSHEIVSGKVSVFMTDCVSEGRFSPVMYRSYSANDFFKKIEQWYKKCVWYNKTYGYKIYFPSLFTIAKCAYGTERIINLSGNEVPKLDVPDNMFKNTVDILLHVVLDNRKVPDSIVLRLAQQVSTPERFRGNEKYRYKNWDLILDTACAVLHMHHMDINFKKGEYDMELNENNTDRSFLFGRLLAVCDTVENKAMALKAIKAGEKGYDHRNTNAMRMWNTYTAHPWTCFENLRRLLNPYLNEFNYGGRKKYEDEIQNIFIKLDSSAHDINRPLSPEYLMGFYLERKKLTMDNNDRVQYCSQK